MQQPVPWGQQTGTPHSHAHLECSPGRPGCRRGGRHEPLLACAPSKRRAGDDRAGRAPVESVGHDCSRAALVSPCWARARAHEGWAEHPQDSPEVSNTLIRWL